MNETEGPPPVPGSLPECGPIRRAPARLRLPCIGKSIRVRSLALGLSMAAHAALLGLLLSSRLSAVPSGPPPLIHVEFVEIPGAQGYGGAPARMPVGKRAAPALSSKAVLAPNLASRQPETPAPSQSVPAAAPAVSAAATATAEVGGFGGGPGGGFGGGQGSGIGSAAGSGTGQGGVTVDRMPTPAHRVTPRYPMAARRRGQSGQVLLRFFVDQEGAVRNVTVVQAEPSGVFEAAAVEAVRQWRFSPAVAHGVAVGMWLTLPVRFALEQQ